MTEAEWLDLFGSNLVFYLNQSDMTQRDLALRTGLSEAAISNYINKLRFPTTKAVINIANALGIGVDELIDFGGAIE